MKKVLSSIIGGTLGLALAVSVGVGFLMGNKSEPKEAEAATQTATFTASNFSGQGTESTGSSVSATVSNVTFSYNKGYADGTTALRCYKGGTMVISSVYTIKSLTFTFQKVSGTTYNGGLNTSYTNLNTTSWRQSSLASQARITKLVVTYDDSKTVTSLAITGNLEKNTFTYGEAWSHKGLSVVATYSDNSTSTISDGISWSYNPGCAVIGVNQLTVTATVAGVSATHTEAITVNKIPSPFINGLAYKMYLNNGTADYYFIGTMNGYYGDTTSTATSTNIVNVYFEANGDGQNIYFYAGNDTSSSKQYITVTTNDTHVNFTFGSSTPTQAWYYNGTTPVYHVSSVDGVYGMGTYGTYHTFGACASYQTSNYFAKFSLVNAFTAEQYATQLLDIITCDDTGATAPTFKYNYTWQGLNDLFDQLGSSEQATLKSADATGSGTIAEAMAKYDYIVAKYGYTNFIERTITAKANRMITVSTNNMMIIIVVMTVIAAAGAGAFMLLRKKKHN